MKKIATLVSFFILFNNILFAQKITNCSTCATTLLNEQQLEDKTLEELALLRNEIFARHGYVFTSNVLQLYFNNQNWYNPKNNNSAIKLSKIETDNVNLLKSIENKKQAQRNAAIADLKKLSRAVKNNDNTTVTQMIGSEISDDLKRAMNSIDINEMQWNNGKALYKIIIDNGYQISESSIYIEKDTITIKTGYSGHSEIMNEFYDGFSDYMSESEYQIWWIFEITDNGIKFIEVNGAG